MRQARTRTCRVEGVGRENEEVILDEDVKTVKANIDPIIMQYGQEAVFGLQQVFWKCGGKMGNLY